MGLRVDPGSAPSLLLFPLARKLKPALIELPISDPELLASLAPTADLQILCGETTIRIFNMRRHGYAYISMPQPSGDIILKLGSPREYIKGSAYRKPQSLDPIIYLYSNLSVYKLNILKESISRIIDLKDEKASQFYKIKSMNYIASINQIEVDGVQVALAHSPFLKPDGSALIYIVYPYSLPLQANSQIFIQVKDSPHSRHLSWEVLLC